MSANQIHDKIGYGIVYETNEALHVVRLNGEVTRYLSIKLLLHFGDSIIII